LILGEDGAWGAASPGLYPNMKVPFTMWFSAWWWDSGKGEPLADMPEPPVLLALGYNDIHSSVLEVRFSGSHAYSSGTTYYSVQGLAQLSSAAVKSVNSLNIAMWCLAGLTCAMSLVWCMLGDPQQHLHFDLMCFSRTLLFALPTMRTMLPEIPATGTRFDFLHLFGQLWLIAFSIFLQAFKLLGGVVHSEYMRRCNQQRPPLHVHKVDAVDASEASVLSSWVHKATCN
jgi:hypothetical protein